MDQFRTYTYTYAYAIYACIYAYEHRFQMTPIRNASVRHLTSAKHAYTPYCAVIRVVEYGCWLVFLCVACRVLLLLFCWFWPQIHRLPISPIAQVHGLGQRVRKRHRVEPETLLNFLSISLFSVYLFRFVCELVVLDRRPLMPKDYAVRE